MSPLCGNSSRPAGPPAAHRSTAPTGFPTTRRWFRWRRRERRDVRSTLHLSHVPHNIRTSRPRTSQRRLPSLCCVDRLHPGGTFRHSTPALAVANSPPAADHRCGDAAWFRSPRAGHRREPRQNVLSPGSERSGRRACGHTFVLLVRRTRQRARRSTHPLRPSP